MPMHDWTRVDAGIYLDFRFCWGHAVRGALNAGLLPPGYHARFERDIRWSRRRRVGVRRDKGDELVAVIDFVIRRNKTSWSAVEAFARKLVRSLKAGVHALIVDPFPPTRLTPHGIHAEVWRAFTTEAAAPTAEPNPIVVAYCAGDEAAAYLESFSVGAPVPEMPLFLTPREYVPVPLEATYVRATADIPAVWRTILDAP